MAFTTSFYKIQNHSKWVYSFGELHILCRSIYGDAGVVEIWDVFNVHFFFFGRLSRNGLHKTDQWSCKNRHIAAKGEQISPNTYTTHILHAKIAEKKVKNIIAYRRWTSFLFFVFLCRLFSLPRRQMNEWFQHISYRFDSFEFFFRCYWLLAAGYIKRLTQNDYEDLVGSIWCRSSADNTYIVHIARYYISIFRFRCFD